VVEEEEITVAVDAVVVVPIAVDAVEDEVIIILAPSIQQKKSCTNLGTNVFDYGQQFAADQMRTSWEKLVHYVGTNY
jgi:hypothetical protein